MKRPFLFAVGVGILAGAVNLLAARHGSMRGELRPDFDHLWFASRALLTGQDPYPLIGPGCAFEWPFGLNYPLPALLAIGPIAWLPLAFARFVFVATGVGLLAYALARDRPHALPLLASAAVYHAVTRGQWSPYFAAALLLPWLRCVYVAKPTIGAALWCSRPSKLPVIAGLLLVAASFALVPRWPLEWFSATRTTSFVVLITLPGGFLLSAAALRWRDPDARLLLALACVPHTTVAYESIYPMLVARTRRAALAFTLLSAASWLLIPPIETYAKHVRQTGILALWLIYLPALAIVLWRGRHLRHSPEGLCNEHDARRATVRVDGESDLIRRRRKVRRLGA